MHIRIKATVLPFLAVMASFVAVSALAQSSAQAEPPQPRPELAVEYNYVHSNAPPGDCGCINLNGGSASFAWPLKIWRLSIVGDIGAVHAGSIASGNDDLTLSSYTAGVRYSPHVSAWHLQPWGQVLVGVAHAGGSLVSGISSGAFASLVGGGVDIRATRRFSFRAVEADYLVTTFNNGGNNHQNNLRIGTGVVFYF